MKCSPLSLCPTRGILSVESPKYADRTRRTPKAAGELLSAVVGGDALSRAVALSTRSTYPRTVCGCECPTSSAFIHNHCIVVLCEGERCDCCREDNKVKLLARKRSGSAKFTNHPPSCERPPGSPTNVTCKPRAASETSSTRSDSKHRISSNRPHIRDLRGPAIHMIPHLAHSLRKLASRTATNPLPQRGRSEEGLPHAGR